MTRRATGWALLVGFATILLWNGCSGLSGLDSPNAGRTEAYEPGLPHFDMEAVATLRDEERGLDVYAGVSPSTLIFAQTDTLFAARYTLTFRVLDEQGRRTEAFQEQADTLVLADPTAAHRVERVRHHARFLLPPGRYVVEAMLEDRGTTEVAVRRQRLEVPDSSAFWLERPLVYAEGDSLPLMALHLPSEGPRRSVRAAYHRLPTGARITSGLFRVTIDTTVATPPFWLGASRGSLVYRGIEDLEAFGDTVLIEETSPAEPSGAQTLALPRLDEGLYQFVVEAKDADRSTLARETRLVSIKAPDFPRVTTLDALIDALAYIAYPREQEFIRAGETPGERRLRFDAFWGSLVSDRGVAADLLRQYYERVEDANLLFTEAKAGWKTDRGMIYIIFGTPSYVEQTFEGAVWHYPSSTQDPASVFTFERVRGGATQDAFEHYVLIRQPIYERAWVRALERWRRGEAF